MYDTGWWKIIIQYELELSWSSLVVVTWWLESSNGLDNDHKDQIKHLLVSRLLKKSWTPVSPRTRCFPLQTEDLNWRSQSFLINFFQIHVAICGMAEIHRDLFSWQWIRLLSLGIGTQSYQNSKVVAPIIYLLYNNYVFHYLMMVLIKLLKLSCLREFPISPTEPAEWSSLISSHLENTFHLWIYLYFQN